MTAPAFSAARDGEVEGPMAGELAAADRLLANVQPILLHLLGNDDHALFSDRIVAQVRAQIEDLARQLLIALEQASGSEAPREAAEAEVTAFAEVLIAEPQLLGHAHALALEAQLGERLSARLALDPVLSPLLQAQIAAPDAETAATAMNLLAAQARFVQAQRRGELALADLPAELLHLALVALRGHRAEAHPDKARIAEVLDSAIRANFDETANRLGLLRRLLAGMGGGASSALNLGDAGLALFATALAQGAGLDRETALLAMSEAQLPRLALALVACGLRPNAIERQFFALHPDMPLPAGFDALNADRAAALLAAASD